MIPAINLAPLLTGVGSSLIQPAVQAIDDAIPQQLPQLDIGVTPDFAAAGPLAATVGADPQRLLQAAEALYRDRDTISGVLHEAEPVITAAAVDIAGIGQSFVASAAPVVPALLAGPTALGALAHLAGLAGEALTAVSQRLTRLEEELAPLVEKLEQLVAQALARPDLVPSASAQAASEELHSLAAADAPTEAAAHVEVPPAANPSEAAGGSAAGRAAVEAAKAQIGTPYVWGGSQPGGFDCSGLTSWAYRQAGVEIPRIAEDQTVGQQVQYEDLQPGDLVVWSGHVAMYAGDGMMVEAGDPVQMSPVRTNNIGMPFKGFWRPTA